jgi:transcriptional regulator with XRE-family HTH domain
MTSISDRIKTVLTYYGLNSGEFASKLDIQKSSVSHLLSGRNKPSFVFLSKFVKVFPEIDIKWLLSGEGNMLENSAEKVMKTDKENNTDEQPEKTEKRSVEQKTLKQAAEITSVVSTNKEVAQIIMIFNDDTFKVLKKSN